METKGSPLMPLLRLHLGAANNRRRGGHQIPDSVCIWREMSGAMQRARCCYIRRVGAVTRHIGRSRWRVAGPPWNIPILSFRPGNQASSGGSGKKTAAIHCSIVFWGLFFKFAPSLFSIATVSWTVNRKKYPHTETSERNRHWWRPSCLQDYHYDQSKERRRGNSLGRRGPSRAAIGQWKLVTEFYTLDHDTP